mmetsp:Transcript_13686/g.27606  ORF Transcript_13686/g.27606 Transcript_13686/m.27606 type:complete len:228 (-) Transcript_13686:218-901(-)|eukprot:CAMPEP_0113818466 /NCGR_PEP_ID=MMETSP0328-20130328/254_1 /TAXON_ID=39455 /ORGANISM="Alexandrium minutum" /LENGTH=227 /DNA_ID=CAMNT_0000786401 /DNA_START=103 /DNA_END=786 /DNA_ORIENTATION=+ /assembly_acc=CAM_ASM_000350
MGQACSGVDSAAAPSEDTQSEPSTPWNLAYPTVYLNVFIHSAEEAVKAGVKEKLESKVPGSSFSIGQKLRSKIIERVQSGAVKKLAKDPTPISQRMSEKMVELLPARMQERGITCTASPVFLKGALFVISLEVSSVDADTLIEAKKAEGLERGDRAQYILRSMPPWMRSRIEGQILPDVVTRKLTELMGKTIEERTAEKGVHVEVEVCKAADEAPLFFYLFKQLEGP